MGLELCPFEPLNSLDEALGGGREAEPALGDASGVATVVVHDQNDRTRGIDRQQVFEKENEVFLAHTWADEIGPLSAVNVEGSEQGPRDVAARCRHPDLLISLLPHRAQ